MTITRRGAFDSDLSVRAVTETTWTTLAPLIWTGTRDDTFAVPVGFETDFATVPRFLHWLISPYGAYTRAAVLHDWLLTELAKWWQENDGHFPGLAPASSEPSRPPANSRDTDGIFRRVMEDLGVPWPKRWAMWAAVRVAALFNSQRSYGRQFARDLPRILGIAALVIPFALPGAIAVLLSLGLIRLVTGLGRLFARKEPS